MGRKGRKPDRAHRTASGQKSRSKAAKIDVDDGLVASQPHRRPFAQLLGDSAARSHLAETALGRLRLIGQAEERLGVEQVRRKLFAARPANGPSNGISEAEYMAAQEYAAAVGRERWVRSAPKDKPSAIAFMVARGIDCSARDLSDREARNYVEQFEESRAALLAAPCSEDMQRVLRQLRTKADRMRKGPARAEATDILRQLRGVGALNMPSRSAAIKRAVDFIVIDDRDPPAETLALAHPGFKALAELHFGDQKNRRAGGIRSFGVKPSDWSVPQAATGSAEQGDDRRGWKGRHRTLAG